MDSTVCASKILLMLFLIQIVVSIPKQSLKDSPGSFLPYNFIFNHNDGHGTSQHREEEKNEDGVVRGSYGYRDATGIYRHVSYEADKNGFHAVVRTNEPGVGNKNSADVAVVAQSQFSKAR